METTATDRVILHLLEEIQSLRNANQSLCLNTDAVSLFEFKELERHAEELALRLQLFVDSQDFVGSQRHFQCLQNARRALNEYQDYRKGPKPWKRPR